MFLISDTVYIPQDIHIFIYATFETKYFKVDIKLLKFSLNEKVLTVVIISDTYKALIKS